MGWYKKMLTQQLDMSIENEIKIKLQNGITSYGSVQYISINENNTSSNNSVNVEER